MDDVAELADSLKRLMAVLGDEHVSDDLLVFALVEVDDRVAKFWQCHGDAALNRAVQRWIDRTNFAQVLIDTELFSPGAARQQTMWNLVDRKGNHMALGIFQLEAALDRLGVLAFGAFCRDGRADPDPERVYPGVRSVVWPFNATDEEARNLVAGLAGFSSHNAGWHILALRLWILRFGCTNTGERLHESHLATLVREAEVFAGLRSGPAGVSDVSSWVDECFERYDRAGAKVTVDGKELHPVITNTVGRAFAAQCGAPDESGLCRFGARELARLGILFVHMAKAGQVRL